MKKDFGILIITNLVGRVQSTLIKSHSHYESISHKLTIMKKDDVSRVQLTCDEGSINIDQLYRNGKMFDLQNPATW